MNYNIGLTLKVAIFSMFICLTLPACSDSSFSGASAKKETSNGDSSNGANPSDIGQQGFGDGTAGGNPVEDQGLNGTATVDDGLSGGINVGDGATELVQSLKAQIQFDGKVSFCVDFSKGEMTLGSSASRLPDSPLVVNFTVKTNGTDKVSEYRSSLYQPSAVHKLGGNWSYVQGAQVSTDNILRGGRWTYDSNVRVENTGTKACFYGDDQKKSQSGQLSVTLNYALDTSK